MTPFIGVRISWLIMARKEDLDLVASSAASLASRSSVSDCFRRVMSRKKLQMNSRSPVLMYLAVVSIGTTEPSMRTKLRSSGTPRRPAFTRSHSAGNFAGARSGMNSQMWWP